MKEQIIKITVETAIEFVAKKNNVTVEYVKNELINGNLKAMDQVTELMYRGMNVA